MYKLPNQLRDEIVNYLSNIVVPAHVGANCKAIADALMKLEELKEDVKNTPEK